MARKKKRLNTTKKETLDSLIKYSIEYVDLDTLIENLNSYKKEYGDKWDRLSLEFELDWGGCYYEGDTPGVGCNLIGEKGRWETDEEYERRCGYKPDDGMCIK